jgi:cytochrome P450
MSVRLYIEEGDLMPHYDPFDASIVADPYPVYAWLRDEAPVYFAEETGTFVLSRYDDVAWAIGDTDLFSSDAMRGVLMGQPTGKGTERLPRAEATGNLVAIDPPAHTELRSIVNRGFTPRRIADWQARIEELVDESLEGVKPGDRFDVVGQLAVRVPVQVIAELLGADSKDAPQFRKWADATTRMASGSMRGAIDPEGITAAMELVVYLAERIEERVREPRDDLLGTLLRARGDHALTSGEASGFAALLMFAGTETTTNLIGNATLALAQHRDQLGDVVADTSLVHGLLEETLRWESPVQYVFRRATRDVEVRGVTIPCDSWVTLLLAAANRDPRHWGDDADAFDLHRKSSGHVGFGFGAHFCLGAALARAEARHAVTRLVPIIAAAQSIDGAEELIDSMQFRGRRRLELLPA